MAGFSSTALGALVGGTVSGWWQTHGVLPLESYERLFWFYAVAGIILVVLSALLSRDVEVAPAKPDKSGNMATVDGAPRIPPSSHAAERLVCSRCVWWRIHRAECAGLLVLLAVWRDNIRARVALFCYQPSVRNFIFHCRTLGQAHRADQYDGVHSLTIQSTADGSATHAKLLVGRGSIAGAPLDFPNGCPDTRQSYVMAVVHPSERAAANGITTTVRSLGSALAPVLAGRLLAITILTNPPIYLAGALKIVYDLALYQSFRHVKPPEEKS